MTFVPPLDQNFRYFESLKQSQPLSEVFINIVIILIWKAVFVRVIKIGSLRCMRITTRGLKINQIGQNKMIDMINIKTKTCQE